MDDLVCLTLVAPQSLADRLGEFLLEHEALTKGFSISDVRFHGSELGHQSLSEQIRGHARRVQVTVIIGSSVAKRLLQEVGQEFPGCGLSYWIYPVSKSGIIE